METKPSSQLVLVAVLSASLTAVISISYVVLSSIAIAYRTKCDVGNPDNISASEFFFHVIYTLYFQKKGCQHAMQWNGVTQASTIHLMMCITLAASVLSLAAAIVLLSTLKIKSMWRYLEGIIYFYAGVYTASLMVDIILATLFGQDFVFLTDYLKPSSPGLGFNYARDMARLGALFLMAVALKGFVAHAINIMLIILLVYFFIQDSNQKPEHSIHRLGPIDAYQSNMFERSESWQPGPEPVMPFSYLKARSGPKQLEPPQTERQRQRPIPPPDYNQYNNQMQRRFNNTLYM